MKKVFISTLVLFFSLTVSISAQEEAKFSVKLSKTTLSSKSKLQVEFVLENASGVQFEAPKFEDFEIVGGPSTASSMQFINGDMTQSITYTYVLKPKKTGNLVIPAASIKVKGETLKTEKVKVKVTESTDEEEIDEEEEAIRQNAPRQNRDPFGSDLFEELLRNNPFFQQQPQPKKEEEKKKKKTITL